MELWTDLIDPATLTGFGREIAENYDDGPLSEFFPTAHVDDVIAEWDVDTLDSLIAEYRAFDAETAIGKGSGFVHKVAKLAPLGRKVRFGEYEQLRRRSAGADAVQAAAEKKAAALARGVIDRINLLRGEALFAGGYTINEGGFVQTVDFGRAAELTVTAGTLWSAAGADPFADLETWATVFADHAGRDATHMIAGVAVANRLRVALTPEGQRKATLEDVNDELSANGLPFLRVVKGSVAGQALVPADKLAFGVSGMTGGTVMGTTVEADDPRYSLEDDLPGVVVGAYKEDDPATKWIRSAAIGLPILANPSMSLSATVL